MFPEEEQAGDTMPILVAVATPVSGEVGEAPVDEASVERDDAGAGTLEEETPSVSTNLFLVPGAALLGAGVLAAFLRRRGR